MKDALYSLLLIALNTFVHFDLTHQSIDAHKALENGVDLSMQFRL